MTKAGINSTLLRRGAAVAVALALAAGAGAVNAASTNADATAEVITPITITKTADLRFGKFAAGTGGTVVVAPAGTRSGTGAVVLSAIDQGGSASFDIEGAANATYAVTLPSSVTITHTDTVNTMTVDTFASDPSGTGTLSAGGTQTLNVGGTLNVTSGQETGSYTGAFTVSVEYN